MAHALHGATNPFESLTGKMAYAFNCASQGMTHIVRMCCERIARDTSSNATCSCQGDFTASTHSLVLRLRLQQCWPAWMTLWRMTVLRATIRWTVILWDTILWTAILWATI